MGDFASEFIQSFHVGRQARLAQEQRAREQELHDLRIKAMKAQMDQAKLEKDLHLHQLTLKGLLEEPIGQGTSAPSPGGGSGVEQFQPQPDQQRTIPDAIRQLIAARVNPQAAQTLQAPVQLLPLGPSAGQLAQPQQQLAPNAATPGYAPVDIGGVSDPTTGQQIYAPRTTTAEAEQRAAQQRRIREAMTSPSVIAAQVRPDTNITPFEAWRQQNPRAPMMDWFKDSAKADQNVSETELAIRAANGDKTAEAALQRLAQNRKDSKIVVNTGASRDAARSDRSYNQASSQLQKMAQPITEQSMRLGRLQDTIYQNTPQADALLAPELLTVMAGGQGSGLRMNEAEIARIVGGRSNWEGIKAALNKWKGPGEALSVTPAQRQQMVSLVSTVAEKVRAKQAILDAASQGLVDNENVLKHRQIVADTNATLSAIDAGAIVQRNANTGAYRISRDGGKTWRIIGQSQ